MNTKQQKMIIWCKKCDHSNHINLPIEIDVFAQLVRANKAIHEHNNECFEPLLLKSDTQHIFKDKGLSEAIIKE